MNDADTSMDFNQTMLELSEAINQLREREEDHAHCSFCGRGRSEVTILVPGSEGVYICDQCVRHAATLIGQRS